MKKEQKLNTRFSLVKQSLLFAVIFFLISAVWVGAWAYFTGSFEFVINGASLSLRALVGDFEEASKAVVIVESVLAYGGAFAFLTMSLYALFKKRAGAMLGALAVLICSATLAYLFGVFMLALESAVFGLYTSFLAVFMLALLATNYVAFKSSIKYIVGYEQKTEVVRVIERQVETPKKAQDESTFVDYPVIPSEDFNLLFENSNAYREYMYHDNVERYMRGLDGEMAEEQEEMSMSPAVATQIVEPTHVINYQEEETEEAEESGFAGINGHNYTFAQKLKLASAEVKDYFKELTTYFVQLGFTPALTKSAETFSYKNMKYAQIAMAGKKGLKVYYKLDVKDYEESTTPVKYVGDVKKYELTPLLFLAKSDLAIRRAKALADDLKLKHIGEEEIKFDEERLAKIFEEIENAELPEENNGPSKHPFVLKPVLAQEEPKQEYEEIEKEQVEEIEKVEEQELEAEEAQEGGFAGINAHHYTFEQKLKMASNEAKSYFMQLTKYFVSLGFTPALTKSGETFSRSNVKYAHITTAGKKGLKVYFKLDTADYENTTIPFKYVGDVKKYEKTPLLFIVKSELAVRRAKQLMDDIKIKLDGDQAE